MNLIEEIKASFKKGTSLTKLIYINLGVFLVIKILQVILFLLNLAPSTFALVTWLAVPAYLPDLATHFWTPITYMFLHEGFIHLLFNMLWLYWFGTIFIEYFDQKKLVTIYLLGGLSGAFLYIFSFNVFPVFSEVLPVSIALGASASVMAIVIAVATYVPNYIVRLILIGPVKIKYIAIAALVFTSILDFSTNTGGKIAHLGGAALGFIYISQFRKGKDIGKWFDRLMDSIFSFFKPRKKMKVSYKKPPRDDKEYNKYKTHQQEEVNSILDKISKGGYDSLSKKEKEILFKMGDKNK